MRKYPSPLIRPFRLAALPGGSRRRRAKTISPLVSLLPAERHLPLFVLGGGSNLLVSDAGFPGLVLRIALRGIDSGIESTEGNGQPVVSAAAGEDWDGLVAYAVAAGYAGVECLSGIPGTVGGTPGAECRRLRAGGFADHRDGARL